MYTVTITSIRPNPSAEWFYRSTPETAALWEKVINAQSAAPGFIKLDLKTPLDHPTSQVWEVKWESEAACTAWEKKNHPLISAIYTARLAYSRARGITREVTRATA